MNTRCHSAARAARRSASWATPTAVLVLMPKCPMCLAAYVTAFTGTSMSLATAGWVRTGLIVISMTALLWLAGNAIRRRWRNHCGCTGPRRS